MMMMMMMMMSVSGADDTHSTPPTRSHLLSMMLQFSADIIMASTAINLIYHEMKSLNAIQASVSALYDEQRHNFHSKNIHEYEGTHEYKVAREILNHILSWKWAVELTESESESDVDVSSGSSNNPTNEDETSQLRWCLSQIDRFCRAD
jgi:hypothetical protein